MHDAAQVRSAGDSVVDAFGYAEGMPLLEIGLKRDLSEEEQRTFPFSVPAIRELPLLDVDNPVTIFVGENGSGKSTLLEAVASAAQLTALGSTDIKLDITLAKQRQLSNTLRLAWRPRSRRGFYLRAEDFFGHGRWMARTYARVDREKAESRGEAPRSYDDEPGGFHADEHEASQYIGRYDSRSHGETYLDLFRTKLEPGGLYMLDEPEAPLSPMRQLEVLGLMVAAAAAGAQLIVATHSPILLACPGARIYTFDDLPIHEVAYEELTHVTVMRDFLNDPDRFLSKL